MTETIGGGGGANHQSSQPTGRMKNQRPNVPASRQIEAAMFVPATPGSTLRKALQKSDDTFADLHRYDRYDRYDRCDNITT